MLGWVDRGRRDFGLKKGIEILQPYHRGMDSLTFLCPTWGIKRWICKIIIILYLNIKITKVVRLNRRGFKNSEQDQENSSVIHFFHCHSLESTCYSVKFLGVSSHFAELRTARKLVDSAFFDTGTSVSRSFGCKISTLHNISTRVDNQLVPIGSIGWKYFAGVPSWSSIWLILDWSFL